MWNVDDPRNVLTGGRRNGLAHLFYEVFGADVASVVGKEAVLSVHRVLGLDLARRVVDDVSQDLEAFACMTEAHTG